MELIGIIGLMAVAAAIIAPIMALKAYQKANQLEQQIKQLKLDIEKLKHNNPTLQPQAQSETITEPIAVTPSITQVTNVSPTVNQQKQKEETKSELNQDASYEIESLALSTQPQFTLQSQQMQQWADKCFDHMRDNWLVWIGGIAMVIGAGYLVQEVGSNFTVPPMLRVILAATISLLLISLGEWAHRKISAISVTFLSERASTYIPAALYSSGMSGLYATILFSTVIYQFFTPSVALIAMAILALTSLALTLRLGSLMAALGLFGGYSAPVWIGGNEPNYLLLSSYILAITLAGLLTYSRSKITWLPTSISIGHCLWLLLIAFSIPTELSNLWYLLFIPLSSYLLVFTPTMGWKVKTGYQPAKTWRYAHPIIPSIGLALVSIVFLKQSFYSNSEELLIFVFPALLLVLPMLRRKLVPQAFYGVTVLATLMVQLSAIAITDNAPQSYVWWIVSILTLIIAVRTYSQYLYGDRDPVAYWMAFLSLPILLIFNLLYLNHTHTQDLNYWAIFSFATSITALLYAHKTRQLVQETSIALHLVILVLSYCYINSELLILVIALQILVAVIQIDKQFCSPGKLAVKAIMSLLIVLMSLIPFVSDLQIKLFSAWSWVLACYLPALIILLSARQILTKSNSELKEWFDASILHVAIVLTFAQSNYWLLGSFNFISAFSFYSASLFMCQSLALFGVYQLKQKASLSLGWLYQSYSYTLLAIGASLFIILNSIYQPLVNTYVVGNDLPLINWLSIGWLVPGIISAIIARYKFHTASIKALHLYAFSATAFALWMTYSIRQFWQEGEMTLSQPTGMAEMFSYSVALIIAGAVATFFGVRKENSILQKVGLATLGVAVFKVFLLDTATLEGIWRAISFLGLGGSLIALGWLFQRLNYQQTNQKKAHFE